MSSLSNITYQIRTLGKFAAFGIVVLVLLFFGYKGVSYVITSMNPPQAPPPEMKYGKIELTAFPEHQKPVAEYRINTITGKLPTLPDRIRVFPIIPPEPELSALQDARSRVTNPEVGYLADTEKKEPSDISTYSWRDVKGNTIRYNIHTRNFEISLNPNSAIPAVPGTIDPSDKLIAAAFAFADLYGARTSDLYSDKENIVYFQHSGSALIPVENPSTATIARVNFQYKPLPVYPMYIFDTTEAIEELPVVHPNVSNTMLSSMYLSIYTIVKTYLLEGKFSYQRIDRDDYSTYPIKTAQQAFEDLQKGNAYYLTSNTSPEIDITDISMGYYIGETPQKYAQPVIVFKGTDFVAYVNALAPYSVAD